MNLKIKGLNIVIDNKGLGYSMTNEAQKEFCQYHGIPYEESKSGIVTTARAYVHSLMLRVFADIGTNNNWRKMHGLPLIRRRGEKVNRSCQNCKWYNLREEIQDEIGKHECYAYSLICSPICLGYKLESGCDKFEEKGNETMEEIEHEWRKRMFLPDESTELLAKALMKSDSERGRT